MSVDVSLDELILLDLDFTPALPCGYKKHDLLHEPDDPAAFIVMYLCPRCPARARYLLCRSGWQRMQPPTLLGCTAPGCGASGYWSDFFILCEPLESAA